MRRLKIYHSSLTYRLCAYLLGFDARVFNCQGTAGTHPDEASTDSHALYSESTPKLWITCAKRCKLLKTNELKILDRLPYQYVLQCDSNPTVYIQCKIYTVFAHPSTMPKCVDNKRVSNDNAIVLDSMAPSSRSVVCMYGWIDGR